MLVVFATTAVAQELTATEQPPRGGWSFTPQMVVGGAWDDNVLIKNVGDTRSDYTTVLNPRASVDFTGRRSSFSANYNGAFQLYRQFDTLNAYEQNSNASLRHKVSPRITWFLLQTFSASPTTELPALVGIPFVRIGSRIVTAKGGVETALSRRTIIGASYDIQWVDFDNDPVLGQLLFGGHSQGGAFTLKHQLTSRTALTADYDLQHARIVDGSTFDVQNGRVGAEYRATKYITVFASGGLAWLHTTDLPEARRLPTWRVGMSHTAHDVSVSVSYGRAYAPVFGRGTTLRDDDLVAQVRVPLARRIYATGFITSQRAHPLSYDPLTFGQLDLTSSWISGAIGWAVQPWMRIEGFYGGAHQNIARPGGEINRNRLGFQVVTVKPMRVR